MSQGWQVPEAGFRLILCWAPQPGVRPGLERMALNFRKTFWEAVWPHGSPPEESVSGAPREARGPLCWKKRVSFLGSSGYTDVTTPLPCTPLSRLPQTPPRRPRTNPGRSHVREAAWAWEFYPPGQVERKLPGASRHITPKMRRMLRPRLLFFKATSNKIAETGKA